MVVAEKRISEAEDITIELSNLNDRENRLKKKNEQSLGPVRL